jgi:adenylate kinase family enzyme
MKVEAKIVFVMGGPGTGKSMICEMIAEQNEGIDHISPE